MMEIINAFRPLIISFSRSPMYEIIETEDLISICHLEIIECVREDKDVDYDTFPGLIAQRLRLRLIREYHNLILISEIVSFDEVFFEDDNNVPTVPPRLDHTELEDLLSRLPERQREAIVLYYYEEYSTRGLARKMGITHSKVRTLLTNGMNNLRKFVQEFF